MAERSADWLAQAERDLEQARWSFQGGFYEWVCFVAQQAAEKAVKALYQRVHGEARGHSVSRLLGLLPPDIAPQRQIVEKAIVLDRYYIQPRYPNGFDSGAPKDYFTQGDAKEAIEFAAAIIEYCRSKLS